MSEGCLGMWVALKNSQPRVVWTMGPGPCLILFCLAEQTAVDRKRGAEDGGDRSGARDALLRGRLGGLDAGGTQGALFLFCFVLSEWGQLLGSGGLSTLRLYKTPPTISQIPRHSPTKRPSVIHKHSSLRLQCWGLAAFCRFPSRACRRPARKRGLLSCRLPGRSH